MWYGLAMFLKYFLILLIPLWMIPWVAFSDLNNQCLAPKSFSVVESKEDLLPSSVRPLKWHHDNQITCEWTQYGAEPHELDSNGILGLISKLDAALAKSHRKLTGNVVLLNKVFHTFFLKIEIDRKPYILEIPSVMDETNEYGRSSQILPANHYNIMTSFCEKGLGRYFKPPLELIWIQERLPVVLLPAQSEGQELIFKNGTLCRKIPSDKGEWFYAFSKGETADILTEMISAIVYLYDPESEGGTAVTDFFVNYGDFLYLPGEKGKDRIRIQGVRHQEHGIDRNRFILDLLGLHANEAPDLAFMSNEFQLMGTPVAISNPSIVFEALFLGLSNRYRDLGLENPEQKALSDARKWIADFGKTKEGRPYSKWIRQYLDGNLPVRFGDDPFEGSYNPNTIMHFYHIMKLQMHQRNYPDPRQFKDKVEWIKKANEWMKELVAIWRDETKIPVSDGSFTTPSENGKTDLNRATPEEIASLVSPVFRGDLKKAKKLAAQICENRPFRDAQDLVARVKGIGAATLATLSPKICFSGIVKSLSREEYKKRKSSPAPRKENFDELANPVVLDQLAIPSEASLNALGDFMSFEEFQESTMFNPEWGYYANHIRFVETRGGEGDFETATIALSGDHIFSSWVLIRAFETWKHLKTEGKLGKDEPFHFIEFGAGNGFFARDVVNVLNLLLSRDPLVTNLEHLRAERIDPERKEWEEFASQFQYVIYEKSAYLRKVQEQNTRDCKNKVQIFEGDAENPSYALKRDFENKPIKGFVFSNELLDVFGVHKVILRGDNLPVTCVVVPRVDPGLMEALKKNGTEEALEMSAAIQASDSALRERYQFHMNPGEFYVTKVIYEKLMSLISKEKSEAEALSLGIHFEETYVPANLIPELSAHLHKNAGQYALALAQLGMGAVVYVNLKAENYYRGIAKYLKEGVVITLDYGGTCFDMLSSRYGLSDFARVFRGTRDSSLVPNYPYVSIGYCDITFNQNFTVLAQGASKEGLHPIYFGPQKDIAGQEQALELFAHVKDSFSLMGKYLEETGAVGFNMLVQSTDANFHLPDCYWDKPFSKKSEELQEPIRETALRIQKALEENCRDNPNPEEVNNTTLGAA